ncbi:hypothetical protein DMENIID0001_072950 [Sergentomyia squamirostris]
MPEFKYKICLHIVQISGLQHLPEGYIVKASVGETCLATDSFSGKGFSSRIDTKLVWEAFKADIFSLKSRNVPIKIHCCRNAKRKENQKVVSTLLFSIRNIPFVSQEQHSHMIAHWHKMTKTQSGVKGNIEILMAIAITKEAVGVVEEDSSSEEITNRKYSTGQTEDTERERKKSFCQELEELEHWKRKQKSAFMFSLKQKEELFLDHLSSEWNAKRNDEGVKLKQNLRDCMELKDSLEREHQTLRELMSTKGKCKCQKESSLEKDKLLRLENEQLKRENTALREKMIENSLQDDIRLLTKELRNVANALRECDKTKSMYKEELTKIHETLQDVCQNRAESRRRGLDLRNLLQKEYREIIQEKKEIQAVKQSLPY